MWKQSFKLRCLAARNEDLVHMNGDGLALIRVYHDGALSMALYDVYSTAPHLRKPMMRDKHEQLVIFGVLGSGRRLRSGGND